MGNPVVRCGQARRHHPAGPRPRCRRGDRGRSHPHPPSALHADRTHALRRQPGGRRAEGSARMNTLRVAMIGHGFMGAAHSQGWRTAPRMFDLPRAVEMSVVVGRNPETTRRSAEKYGWLTSATDWRAVVERDDIDVVDIVASGEAHAEIAITALKAGKHVLCEKPLANTVAEAEAMVAAAEKADALGVRSMVGFNYRRVPA